METNLLLDDKVILILQGQHIQGLGSTRSTSLLLLCQWLIVALVAFMVFRMLLSMIRLIRPLTLDFTEN